ncbi:MAG: TetR family transcriptional regulator [Micrococcales bacterium]|nr:TetR family transcriptional regulator [Micrococcales bacterium]
MPRLIDHEARATEITEAAWRVLVRGGVPAVSVRNVAEEAGLATASLRRSFPTQSDLLVACLALLEERVGGRIRALPQRDALEWAIDAIAETVPLDATRRVEMEVHLALGAAAFADERLATAFQRSLQGLQRLSEQIVAMLAPGMPPARLRRAALHLAALVDGLALRILHGGQPRDAMAVLREHLRALAGESA